MTFLSAKALYAKKLQDRYGKPVGCNQEEIANLERDLGFFIPAAYKDFLLWMGNDKNGFFRGSEIFCSDVVENRQTLYELLEHNQISLSLPSKLLVFFSHQGYMAAWFDAGLDNPDPPTSFFAESDSGELITYEKFSDFLTVEFGGEVIPVRVEKGFY
jgi:SMI1 / KNR4 family (SUKH-1)